MSPATTTLVIPSEYLADLCGYADENLRYLENSLDAQIHLRGNVLRLSGTPTQISHAQQVFHQLIDLAQQGQPLTGELLAHLLDQDPTGHDHPDSAPGYLLLRGGRTIRAKTPNQTRYLHALAHHPITLCVGPAGTGKTYLAIAQGLKALQDKHVTRIILTRPVVEAGERLGFLPGSITDKIDPYLRPLYDALYEMIDPELMNRLMSTGIIEVAPLAYMRGRTLNNAYVILDEAQNTTVGQMKMFLTRLGCQSQMVITGDVTQTDLPHGHESGLVSALKTLTHIDDIAIIELAHTDVVRHRLVSQIINAYQHYRETPDLAQG